MIALFGKKTRVRVKGGWVSLFVVSKPTQHDQKNDHLSHKRKQLLCKQVHRCEKSAIFVDFEPKLPNSPAHAHSQVWHPQASTKRWLKGKASMKPAECSLALGGSGCHFGGHCCEMAWRTGGCHLLGIFLGHFSKIFCSLN